MRKRVQIALAVLLVAVTGLIAWQVLREREPLYQGKPLSFWLTPQIFKSSYEARQAQAHSRDDAVLQIGSNAVPCLIQILRAKDSTLKLSLIKMARRQNIIKIRYTTADEWNRRALHGFEVLGAKGNSAVPTLIDMANRSLSRKSRLDALEALAYVGPPAGQAIPSLLRWATNDDAEFRCGAIFALGRIRSDPNSVVPALTNALHDSNNLTVRIYALVALERFGPDAKLAVPALLKYFETDSTSRSGDALKAIDPEAATRAGVK